MRESRPPLNSGDDIDDDDKSISSGSSEDRENKVEFTMVESDGAAVLDPSPTGRALLPLPKDGESTTKSEANPKSKEKYEIAT